MSIAQGSRFVKSVSVFFLNPDETNHETEGGKNTSSLAR